MNLFSSRRSRVPVVALLAFLALAATAVTTTTLRAETVKYPKDDPEFSISFPGDWQTKVDPKDNTVSSQPAPDRACILTLGEMEGVDDLATAKAALPALTTALAEETNIKELKPSHEPAEGRSSKGVPMIMAEFRGTSESGVTMVISVVVFQPGDDADVFVLTGVASAEEDEKIEKQAAAIVDSITPI